MPRFSPDALKTWTGGDWTAAPALPGFDAVSVDTRTLAPDALFVAIPGERFDGHAFVARAFEAGAAAAVVARREPDWDAAWPLLVVPDTRRALREAANGYRRAVDPLTIGITGSAGKTTVKALLAALLGVRGTVGATLGNWNNAIGLPLSLLAMPRDARFGVFELGANQPGEISALCDVLEPDWGIVTTVGPAHLERFRTLDGVAREKAALPRHLPAEGLLALDADGGHAALLREHTQAEVVSVSVGGEADYTGYAEPRALRVREAASGAEAVLPQPLPGRHQSLNLLLAMAVARRAGVGWDAAVEALQAPPALPMRWECLSIDGVTVVNDAYNANPLSMRASIAAFGDDLASGRRWLVLGDMLELGPAAEAVHRELGAWLAGREWAGLVAVGPLARHIVRGAAEAGWRGESPAACDDVDAAAAWLRNRLGPGDRVLLKASRSVGLERLVHCLTQHATKGVQP